MDTRGKGRKSLTDSLVEEPRCKCEECPSA